MPTDDIALPDGHVRITPAQRDRALAALRDAAADERLRFEELEARSDAVLRASTRDDLASVLYDLLPGAALEATVSDLLPVSSAPGMSWDTPLLFEGEHWWKTRQIRGEWDVPPFIEVVASQGSVLLDFLQARPLSPVIDMTLTSSWLGGLTLVVPRGWGVDVTSFPSAMSLVSTAIPTRPQAGLPRIVVRGSAGASFNARYATTRELRRTGLAG